MRRFSTVSVGVHVVLAGILALGFGRPQRPIFAEPLYEVALLESSEPNFQPPRPARASRKEPEAPRPDPAEKIEPETVPVPKKSTPEPRPKTPEPKVEKRPEKTPEPEKKKATSTPQPLKPPVKREEQAETAAPEADVETPEDLPDEPVSLGRVDQKDFKHNYYLQMVRARLAREWRRPDTGRGLIKTAVHFIIQRDGTVVQPFVEEPSGNSLYDRAALGAVISVEKLPPLPEAYSGDQLGITVVFQTQAE
jgi:TonB family protein